MPTFKIQTDGHEYEALVTSDGSGGARVTVAGRTFHVSAAEAPEAPTARQTPVVSPSAAAAATGPAPASVGGSTIAAPIPGTVLEILVQAGDSVRAGQKVLVLEAMKMENDITATRDGVVAEVLVTAGDQVRDRQPLITFADEGAG